MEKETLIVGLAGNPNTGKTTLFNQLTGASQRVGNWAGVTTERKEGFFSTTRTMVHLVDLPGLYSLTMTSREASVDEQIAAQFIAEESPGLLINVIDASALQRNLWMTLQLRATGIPCIVVLNMMDVAAQLGRVPEAKRLAERLGCPVIPMVSTRRVGLDALKHAIDHLSETPPVDSIDELLPLPESILRQVREISAQIRPEFSPSLRRWLALQITEGDIFSRDCLNDTAQSELPLLLPQPEATALEIAIIRQQAGQKLAEEVADPQQARPHRLTQIIDRLAMNRWLGLPVFFLMMYLMFFLAINVGGALQPLFDQGSVTVFIHGIQWLGWAGHIPSGITGFLAQGIGGGINTVLPLIPQIGIMYLLMTFMEDSGYMARAAFVMDRLMQWLGLPGKSFVPLITGFGCNVPAVTGARTLDSPRERLVTLLMAPFMSCGARLAIFAVFSSVFFEQQGALAVFALYLTGIVVAVITGLILKHTLLRGEARPFVMELPLYHLPHFRSLIMQSWQRLREFVWRAGKVIVLFSLIISALNSFAFNGKPAGPENPPALQTVGRALTPLLQPMGIAEDNWQATVGLITGAMAKEVVIGTLNTLYTSQIIDEEAFDPASFHPGRELLAAWQATRDSLSETFTSAVMANPLQASEGDAEISAGATRLMQQKFAGAGGAFCYLLFVLLYVPCASVMGAISRESSRNWMLFSVFWGLSVAWSVATVAWQLISFIQHPFSAGVTLGAVLLYNLLLFFTLSRFSPRKLAPAPVSAGCRQCRGCGTGRGCH